jgi:hypothetical protein
MMYLEQDSIGQHQDRLICIIDPGQSSAMGTPTYTTTHRNKNVNDRSN